MNHNDFCPGVRGKGAEVRSLIGETLRGPLVTAASDTPNTSCAGGPDFGCVRLNSDTPEAYQEVEVFRDFDDY